MCFKIIMGSNSLFKKTYTCIDIFIWAFPGSSVGKESVSNAGDHISIPDSGRFPGDKISYPRQCSWASLVAQMVKNLPAMQETQVHSLVLEDPLEEGMASHFSIHAARIPWTEKPGGLQPMGSQRVGHD